MIFSKTSLVAISSRLWSKAGQFQKGFAKGPQTTPWICNFHADAHDFQILQTSSSRAVVFSSNLAHLSLVFFWITGMHFHGAYFSNYASCLKDPKHVFPTAHVAEAFIGQDILNSQLGIRITSGIFQLWRSQGIITQIHLKYGCTASLIGTILSLAASSFHIHMSPKIQQADSFFKKFKSISSHHLAGLFGFGSLSWSAHQIHISFPFHALLDSGIDPAVIPCGYHVLFKDFWLARSHRQVGAHHFSIGIVFLPSSLLCQPRLFWFSTWHAQLSINLAIAASLSIAFSHHIYAIPIYPYLASDYPTLLSLFSHHMWIGGFFTIGAAAHASIFIIAFQNSSPEARHRHLGPKLFLHRDLILGHLLWVSLALGFHSFSLYIHNDTFQAFGRSEDIFDDNSLQLYPLYTRWVQSFASSFDMKILALQDLKKLIKITQEFRTADFLVHHIHAFTIHTAFFIFSKAILYARSSRLVSDKFQLGFRYPCDGPGRGGTCQISPWDHIFLALFWMYNSLSVVLFHYFWKMQSDLWGISAGDLPKIIHITAGDFSLHSSTIHGWLRNFLWSQSAQVIQSYTSSISGYGFIFIRAHFLWAFSLMFFYSGRGYWQELIESILWAHHKFKIIPNIQPRALSISQGRAVGFAHFLVGGLKDQ